jgi:uncharacterized protein YuzE
MSIKEIKFDYDEEADVLYISFGKPKEAIVEEIGNIGIRIDERTAEVRGLTIIEFLKTFSKKHAPIKIPVEKIVKSMKS